MKEVLDFLIWVAMNSYMTKRYLQDTKASAGVIAAQAQVHDTAVTLIELLTEPNTEFLQ